MTPVQALAADTTANPPSSPAQDFVLYLNLWGTTAKLSEAGSRSGDTVEKSACSSREVLAHWQLGFCQRHFARVLREAARETPEVAAVQLGDIAYARSKDIQALAKFAAATMKGMTLFSSGDVLTGTLNSHEQFVLWPLRAAIAAGSDSTPAKGLECEDLFCPVGQPKNFISHPLIGEASVEAAYLEKSAQKGMRLFLSQASGESLLTREPRQRAFLRERSTRGVKHFEFNWMISAFADASACAGSGSDASYLQRSVSVLTQDHDRAGEQEAIAIAEHYRLTARQLIQIESNYSQQLGSSLSDLLSWSIQLDSRLDSQLDSRSNLLRDKNSSEAPPVGQNPNSRANHQRPSNDR